MAGRKPKQTTIQDIARKLGLSSMTVSRALRGHPAVKAETRRKVLALAAELKYRPNRWARSLVTGKSKIIGVVVPDISHSFFSDITRGVQDAIEKRGYTMMLCHSKGDARRERSEIDTLLGAQVDGLIVASEQPEDSPDVFLELQQHETPFVLVDRFFSGLDCPRLGVDDRAVGRLATRHLVELGHTRIAHIRGPDVSTSLLRTEGYVSALKESGLPVTDSWIVSSNFGFEAGADAMSALLRLIQRPTAVFAGNDPSAIGAIRGCRAAGLEVPGDVSIVGAGNIEGADHPNPFLTTVDWPRHELGRRAGTMLLRLIDGQPPLERTKHILRPQLLVRNSTAKPGQFTLSRFA